MPEKKNEYRIVLLGANNVGKTCLTLRFINGTFRENYVTTIEDTYTQVMTSNQQVCTLEMTDTNGNHEFPAMERLAMMRGHAFILVYSVTCRNSFESIKAIYTQLKTVRGNLQDTPIMLVGNKVDESKKKMEVSMQDGQGLAQQLSCGFMETSAKHNVNVRETIQQLLQQEKQRNVAWLPINEAINHQQQQQQQQQQRQSSKSKMDDKKCLLM